MSKHKKTSGEETIYVRLLDEGTDVFRPVKARKVKNGEYVILPIKNYDQLDESWEFPPFSIVKCREKQLSSGKALVAVDSTSLNLGFISDLIIILKEDAIEAKKVYLKNKNSKNKEWYNGILHGYYRVLSTFKNQLTAFNMDLKGVGFDFDPDKELLAFT